MHQASSKSSQKNDGSDNLPELLPRCFNTARVLVRPFQILVAHKDWADSCRKNLPESKMELTVQFSDKKVILQTHTRPGLADSKKESKWFEWKTHFCKMPIWTVDLPSPAPCKAVQYHVMGTGIACSGAMIVCRCFGEDFFCWRDMDETTYPCQMILIIYQMQTSSKARCNTQNS